MASGIQLQVQMDDPATVQVHVGPEWYLKRQEIELHEHEAVQVTGALAEVDGQPALLARTISWNRHTLMLRDTQGQPLWSVLLPSLKNSCATCNGLPAFCCVPWSRVHKYSKELVFGVGAGHSRKGMFVRGLGELRA
jgi:hypothetical protein